MTADNCTKAVPFLRWAGGKRWLAPALSSFAHDIEWSRYIEPFLGSGAIFFEVKPQSALLADINEDLINSYVQVKADPALLERELTKLPVSESQYYHLRSENPGSPLGQAVRFIYLNRTCFNGIWRTNRKGEFNVPYGRGTRSTSAILGNLTLQRASKALATAKLKTGDFRQTLGQAGYGDFVFCDPAYTVACSNGAFLRYNEKVFAWEDQIALHDHIIDAYQNGAIVVLSNAADTSIAKLYHPFKPIRVVRRSSVAARKGRGLFSEYLFVISKARSHRYRLERALESHNRLT